MHEPVVFDHAIEAFFLRALSGKLSANAEERIRVAGIDFSKPLLPAYSLNVWFSALDIAAKDVFPNLPGKEAYFELGRQLIVSYQETLLGRALFAALRLMGARRILDRMARNFRTGNNYTETKITEVGPNCVDVWMNIVEPHPTFTQGILSTGLMDLGVKGVHVEVVAAEGRSATYRIRWSS